MAATEATRVSDVLAKAANSTTADIAGLGNGLSYVAPLARQLGLDVEDTVAVLGALADQGFRGERAGTALRSMLSELLDPASDFARFLRDIGIESTDLGEVIEQLAAKGDLGRQALLRLDSEARPAIQALVNGGTAQLGTLEAALRAAGGSAAETAATMGENLSGAAERISDTFDRTRRSFVEPLLEPIAKELEALSADLDAFAKSPDFAILRESLVDLFQEGATAARELLENVDFAALAQEVREFATDSDGSLSAFAENLRTVTNAVVLIGQTTSVVFNAVQTAVLGISSAVTGSIALLAGAVDNLSPPVLRVVELLGLIEGPAAKLREFAGGMAAVSDDFAKRTIKNFDETLTAAGKVGTGLLEAGEDAAAGSEKAALASDRSAEASKKSAAASEEAADASTKQGEASSQTAAKTGEASNRMEADAARLKKAFSDLGITAQADLTRTADAARRSFELVQRAAAAGEASAEDVRRAFAAYAEAARAAVSASDESKRIRVENELAVQAAVLGVTTALDAQGAAGARAGQQVAQGAVIAAQGMQQAAAGAVSYSDSVQWVSDSTQKAGGTAQKAATQLQSFGLTVGSVSLEFTKAALAANRFVNSIDNSTWRNSLNRLTAEYEREARGLREQMETLDRELAKDDPMVKRVEELRAQYRYLGEDQLRALAEKEKQVADLQRQQEEAAASAEEASRQAQRERSDADQATAAVASITGRTAAAAASTSQVLAEAERAAAAISSASTQLGRAAAGEVVVRLISEAPPGAVPVRLSPADIRTITTAVVGELNRQRGLTG